MLAPVADLVSTVRDDKMHVPDERQSVLVPCTSAATGQRKGMLGLREPANPCHQTSTRASPLHESQPLQAVQPLHGGQQGVQVQLERHVLPRQAIERSRKRNVGGNVHLARMVHMCSTVSVA